MPPRLDTSTAGLLRLYYRIVLTVVAAVLLLQVLTWLLFRSGEAVTPPRVTLYGAILLFSWFGHELVRSVEDEVVREPRGILLAILGLLQVILCIETGGLASAYYMLVVATCIFAALTMRSRKAFLLTSLIGAAYCAASWLYPSTGGLIEGSLQDFLATLRTGRRADAREVSALVIHCGFLYVGSWIAMRLSWGFREQVVRLETTATRDPLTELPNRRGFMEKMEGEIQRARDYDWPIAILVIDLDLFKKVNDRYGHPVGDKVLQHAGRVVRDVAGPLDHVARIGGEEFAVAAVGTDRRHGADLADRIVRAFRAYDWSAAQPGLRLTCSVGVAVVHPGRTRGPLNDLAAIIDEADKALLVVKNRGRNGFLVAGDTLLSDPSGREGPAEAVPGLRTPGDTRAHLLPPAPPARPTTSAPPGQEAIAAPAIER